MPQDLENKQIENVLKNNNWAFSEIKPQTGTGFTE